MYFRALGTLTVRNIGNLAHEAELKLRWIALKSCSRSDNELNETKNTFFKNNDFRNSRIQLNHTYVLLTDKMIKIFLNILPTKFYRLFFTKFVPEISRAENANNRLSCGFVSFVGNFDVYVITLHAILDNRIKYEFFQARR